MDSPISDTARSIQHDPDRSWPTVLTIQARWPNGMTSAVVIPPEQFFGTGSYGAPLHGDGILGMIKHLIGRGAPEPDLPPAPRRKAKNGKAKAARTSRNRTVDNRKGAAVRGKRKGPSRRADR